MSERPATAATDSAIQPPRQLRALERIDRRGAKFAAVDHDVAHVLGPHRGAATCYGVLASAWYEFAPPSDKLEGKKRPAPGDWVEVTYRQLMDISGTNAKASIIRWLRILAEDFHPCPWGKCGDEHPLIVVKRQGQSRPNRYRKWRCGEDELVVRRRVRSQKLSEAARRRVASGQRLNGITESGTPLMPDAAIIPEEQLALLKSYPGSLDHPEVLQQDFRDVSLPHFLKSCEETSESLATELQEVLPQDHQKSYSKTSLRVKREKPEKTAAKKRTAAATATATATATDVVDEVDAVACEVVDAVLELAHRVEPEYTDDRAWAVARQLATAALTFASAAAAARSLVLAAIADRRLSRARNPVGLLLRGMLGDEAGNDRFLVSMTGEDARAIAAIRAHGRESTAASVAAEEGPDATQTPLCDEFGARDPAEYRRRLEAILAVVEIPAVLRLERSLDHPMLLGMCRARLERELRGDR